MKRSSVWCIGILMVSGCAELLKGTPPQNVANRQAWNRAVARSVLVTPPSTDAIDSRAVPIIYNYGPYGGRAAVLDDDGRMKLASYSPDQLCFTVDASERALTALQRYDLLLLGAKDTKDSARVVPGGTAKILERYTKEVEVTRHGRGLVRDRTGHVVATYDEPTQRSVEKEFETARVCFDHPPQVAQEAGIALRGTDDRGFSSFAVLRLAPM